MNIDSIKNGYVIDHIQPGKALEIYDSVSMYLDEKLPIWQQSLGEKYEQNAGLKSMKFAEISHKYEKMLQYNSMSSIKNMVRIVF